MKRHPLHFFFVLSILFLFSKGLLGQSGEMNADDKDALPYQVEEIHQLVMGAHEKPENAGDHEWKWAEERVLFYINSIIS